MGKKEKEAEYVGGKPAEKDKTSGIRLRASVSVGLSSNELPAIDYDPFSSFFSRKNNPSRYADELFTYRISHASSLTEF